MIIDDLKHTVQLGKQEKLSQEYIKIKLKELLIYHTLNFIYNSNKWKNLIFNGGTALKVIGNTTRLSEDLDLDYLDKQLDAQKFSNEILQYFKNQGLNKVVVKINRNEILILKFPILQQLRLITNIKNESNFLHLKIELAKNQYSSFTIQKTPSMINNLFFVITNYDLPTLFANKIGAVLGRKDKLYHNKYDFKGRDFYDLIWFLKQDIKPNFARVKQIIKHEQQQTIRSDADLWLLVRKRIKEINTTGIATDLKNLVKNQVSVEQLSQNYLAIYDRLTKHSLNL